MSELRVYKAHHRATYHYGRAKVTGTSHTGTYGFTNYFAGSSEDVARGLEKVFADFPDAVVIDGSDDWFAKPWTRPGKFINAFEIKPLALFHSGSSGVSKSGIIITEEDFDKIVEGFPKHGWILFTGPQGNRTRTTRTGIELGSVRRLKVYRNPRK